MVFFILAAQYEKWSLPLSVLLALPFGTFGAGGDLSHNLLIPIVGTRPLSNDVYSRSAWSRCSASRPRTRS
jgi:HAE1 family hydrophobic/amphiphilic exporter-1/multidrug efflux pump